MHSWTYDGIGNRTSAAVNGTPTSYTYFKNPSNPLNGQRLQSDGVSTYTYDANGNTLTRTGTPGSFTFGWDAQDRLTSIAGSATATYTYDYQGRRTSTTVGGATTSYLYDGLNLVRTSGASEAEYLFGPGIDEPLAMLRGGVVYHYSVDGLGSVALVTNQDGTTVHDAYLYDAWGKLRRQTGTVANDFGYTGREFAEAGLWYYRARYYQPGIGRFGSEDLYRPRRWWMLYSYVLNYPTFFRNPLGLEPARDWESSYKGYRPPRCACDPDAVRRAYENSTWRHGFAFRGQPQPPPSPGSSDLAYLPSGAYRLDRGQDLYIPIPTPWPPVIDVRAARKLTHPTFRN
ncbi:MAG: RHS repeat-associated core domain-containing protein [Thermoanaerobaculaceae bacterium]|nr:RHS repeat-associated core domain-containing protein [Thermoanaerobaculaceae bacterium]MDI9620989.1 RHS repeat-associated core domain-containing protein [Acidobacteriota bacterium]NLH12697.1 RHS repeat-associated core domain-containing protein [Holophagae bacterium]HPW56689.1 RHS repeat-associated core domain-containing protein [Thermoanaerobaculaceae bacterium]